MLNVSLTEISHCLAKKQTMEAKPGIKDVDKMQGHVKNKTNFYHAKKRKKGSRMYNKGIAINGNSNHNDRGYETVGFPNVQLASDGKMGLNPKQGIQIKLYGVEVWL
ncbi:hypothetical protein FQA39_LY19112 [Lamprigera yunnana]|nr:hypothetical protein FQA39_LY19112 [Lamprigera yunnana]